ncbi:hypothetical protein TNCV_3317221 [Trichonephila clavipes]|nr:hypothetical protein TNCV_3317221 [Trichonephila clavipes]
MIGNGKQPYSKPYRLKPCHLKPSRLKFIAMSFETSLYLFVDSFYMTPTFYPKLAFIDPKGRLVLPKSFFIPTLHLGSKRDATVCIVSPRFCTPTLYLGSRSKREVPTTPFT